MGLHEVVEERRRIVQYDHAPRVLKTSRVLVLLVNLDLLAGQHVQELSQGSLHLPVVAVGDRLHVVVDQDQALGVVRVVVASGSARPSRYFSCFRPENQRWVTMRGSEVAR